MPNIQKIDVTTHTVKGLGTRTSKNDEQNSTMQKLPLLWQEFMHTTHDVFKQQVPLYVVYHDYESDEFAPFNVTVGVSSESLPDDFYKSGLRSVSILGGRYLKFPVKGKMPQAMREAWKLVSAYFEDPSIDERRAYETDYEYYLSKDEGYIYVGVHYF